MTDNLEGKRVVITGASAGLGMALAEQAANQGAWLLLVARRGDRLVDLAGRLRAKTRVWVLSLDLSLPENGQTLVDYAHREMGGIDILILNSGREALARFEDIDLDEARYLMNLNYFSPLVTTQAALPEMLKAGRGQIVLIASAFSYCHIPTTGHYAASKAAVSSLFRVLSTELPPEIAVTVVYPGVMKTEMYARAEATIPIARWRALKGITADGAARRVLTAIHRRTPVLKITPGAYLGDIFMRAIPVVFNQLTRYFYHHLPAHLVTLGQPSSFSPNLTPSLSLKSGTGDGAT